MQPKIAVPLVIALLLSGACAHWLGGGSRPRVHGQDPPSVDERYCAWFGHARDPMLYFGQAAFWAAFREGGGDPEADRRIAGPQLVGRFDIEAGRMLPPLDVSEPGATSGVWDVLAHPNGRVYYTTFFDAAGSVDPDTGHVAHYAQAGPGLNEIVLGPDDTLLVTRYGSPGGGDGGVVVLDPDGSVLREHRLDPMPGYQVAAKSLAWDPNRQEIWVNTDLLAHDGSGVRNDLRILDRHGRQRVRVEEPEVQFMAFRPDGYGVTAEADAAGLWLRVLRPEDEGQLPFRGERVLVERDFRSGHDFAQDIQFAPGGRAVVTRWSGRLHVLDPSRPVPDTLVLPRPADGLYYTGVLRGSRLCATRCADVDVVCSDGALPQRPMR
jgi:hypothetical protein